MIKRALSELSASAEASLGNWIDAVAAHHNVELDRDFSVYSWWKTDTELLKIVFPALSFAWQGSKTAIRGSHGRVAVHGIVMSYGFRAADMDAIERHILHVPEAVLRWIDEFPTKSRSPGAAILGVALNEDGRSRGEIEISHGPVGKPGAGAPLMWAVDFDFTVITHDEALPALLNT